MTLKRLSPVALLAGIVVLGAGCHLFHKQKAAAPELPPAVGIEVEFRDRWIDRRVHDLTSADPSLTAEAARRTAEEEFAKQYPYVGIPSAPSGR